MEPAAAVRVLAPPLRCYATRLGGDLSEPQFSLWDMGLITAHSTEGWRAHCRHVAHLVKAHTRGVVTVVPSEMTNPSHSELGHPAPEPSRYTLPHYLTGLRGSEFKHAFHMH